jgi:hypothetical protein
MSILHSKFIVHWTGWDFHTPSTHSNLDDHIRTEYVNRLIDDLKYGFFMKTGNEEIFDQYDQSIKIEAARVCFSEIKLSLVQNHSHVYGMLGIGVDRNFIRQRFGNPVFYVKNGKYSNLMVYVRRIMEYLKVNNIDLYGEYLTLLSYFKNMNDKNADELIFYDEMEWRITDIGHLKNIKLITIHDESSKTYRLKLNKDEVKLIVFPDEKTKLMTFSDKSFKDLINNPILMTLEDCEHF